MGNQIMRRLFDKREIKANKPSSVIFPFLGNMLTHFFPFTCPFLVFNLPFDNAFFLYAEF